MYAISSEKPINCYTEIVNRREDMKINMSFMENPELSFEISECGLNIPEDTEELNKVIDVVHKKYGDQWKFSRIESRYQSCIMMIFERY